MAYPNTNTTNIAFTGTSQSQVLSGKAKQIALSADAACYISFDSTFATTTNGFYIPANQQFIFHVLYPPQISVIQSASAGTLSVMEFSDICIGFDITVSDTYTGDTNLKIIVADTFDCDSSLLRTRTATYLSDATINTLHEDTFAGDSNIATNYEVTFSSDCHLDV